MLPVLPADEALRVSHARIIAPRRTPKIKRSFMPNEQWFPAHVNFRAPVVSPRALYAPAFAGPARPVNLARFNFLDPHARTFWGD